MKKKLLTMLLALTLSVSCLTACGDSSSKTDASKTESSSMAETTTSEADSSSQTETTTMKTAETTTTTTTTQETTTTAPEIRTELSLTLRIYRLHPSCRKAQR